MNHFSSCMDKSFLCFRYSLRSHCKLIWEGILHIHMVRDHSQCAISRIHRCYSKMSWTILCTLPLLILWAISTFPCHRLINSTTKVQSCIKSASNHFCKITILRLSSFTPMDGFPLASLDSVSMIFTFHVKSSFLYCDIIGNNNPILHIKISSC